MRFSLAALALGFGLAVLPTPTHADGLNVPRPSWAFLSGIGYVPVTGFSLRNDTLWLDTPTERIAIRHVVEEPKPLTPADGSSYWDDLVLRAIRVVKGSGGSELVLVKAVVDSLVAHGAASYRGVVVRDCCSLELYWKGNPKPSTFSMMVGHPDQQEALRKDLETYQRRLEGGWAFVMTPPNYSYPRLADSTKWRREPIITTAGTKFTRRPR